MSETPPPSNDSSKSFLYGTTIAFAILIILCIIVIFSNKNTIPNFKIIFWVVIPACIFLVSSGLNLIGQWMACRTVAIGKGFLAALATVLTSYASMGLSQIATLRVPIGSIFSSYFATRQELSESSLEMIEAKHPILMGISVAYYMFWGIMFGQVITTGLSAGCLPTS